MGSGAGREVPPPAVPGYDVLALLGRGASSTVWQARRRADGLVVALKVLVKPRRSAPAVAATAADAGSVVAQGRPVATA